MKKLKTVNVGCLISQKLFFRFKAYCKKHDRTNANGLRLAIKELIKNDNNKP